MKHSIATRGGVYALAITALAIAIAVGVNLIASALPSSWTRFDISASKLYSVTSSTKAVISRLETDVTVYWIVQADKEDDVLGNLLEKYESLSPHIRVVKRNPDVYPTFAERYTDETPANNSLVVECGEKHRYIPVTDIYVEKTDPYSYSYSTSFDGEGAITSAIDYCVTQELPKVYALEGHGESALPENFQSQVEKENLVLETVSLLTVDEIPQDADCLLIYSPESDLSPREAEMLSEYVSSGGKLLVMAGPGPNGDLSNLNSLLTDHGVMPDTGVVMEGDRGYYAFQYPYLLIPDMLSSDITNSLMEERYLPLLPLCAGLRTASAGEEVTAFLTTSDSAFSKASGYSTQREEGDRDGPFVLGVSIDCGNDGKLVWISSSGFLEDTYNAYSSGANQDMAMNALSSLIGQREALAIRSKSLNYNYLTISDSAAALLKTVMIGLFPLAYLGAGIAVAAVRRRRQNETK